ncbi:hypothetical protein FNV43_RR19330 [Rhamnella rubrinervis]|uniref:PLAT domain-containing protein n=1 Tax=Rhamnella rubrinervis TaxID=2594499 RepID=A0A8K0E7R8_9ROSA|nr:hypothetical protein FNV43_RR19330 [Rhamnella rubrinervis]
MKLRHSLLLSFFFGLSIIAVAQSSSEDYECVYTIYVRTGSIWKGGTDSKIAVSLYAKNGDGVQITDIEDWGGLMGPGHNYFERGNLDIFSGRGPCLGAPICGLNLTSDGSGPHHGWYCSYVEVTTTGPHIECNQQLFTIDQWLATDVAPYDLTAIRESCSFDMVNLNGRVKSVSSPRLRSVVSEG